MNAYVFPGQGSQGWCHLSFFRKKSMLAWSVLKNYTLDHPFFLSGGIGLNSIEKIDEIRRTGLPIHALDINSKFETVPGLKNIDDIKLFKEKLAL